MLLAKPTVEACSLFLILDAKRLVLLLLVSIISIQIYFYLRYVLLVLGNWIQSSRAAASIHHLALPLEIHDRLW